MSRCAALLLAAALAGCAGSGPGEPGNAPDRRIVVMAPAAAGMLEALDSLDLVVGVGDVVTSPPSLAALPRIGAYDRPNVERVLSLEADLLLTASSREADPAHARLEANEVLVGDVEKNVPEGALLPDTYAFTRGTTRQEVVDRMKAAQDKLLTRIWPGPNRGTADLDPL